LAALFDIEEDDDNQAKDEEGKEQDVKNPKQVEGAAAPALAPAEALEHDPVAAAPPAQHMNNEPSSLRILDIIAADVFLSYSWGKQDPVTKEYSTQKIVMCMRPQIEQDAGVLTWVDVAMLDQCGVIGQNAIDEKMEGIRKCTVVVIFISDAYCKSANCKREFLHATKHGKHLITVLVPDNGPAYDGGPSSGWTGPGPDDKVRKCTRNVHVNMCI
jgi:hypothetical protein